MLQVTDVFQRETLATLETKSWVIKRLIATIALNVVMVKFQTPSEQPASTDHKLNVIVWTRDLLMDSNAFLVEPMR
jgi:hypothetical protein